MPPSALHFSSPQNCSKNGIACVTGFNRPGVLIGMLLKLITFIKSGSSPKFEQESGQHISKKVLSIEDSFISSSGVTMLNSKVLSSL